MKRRNLLAAAMLAVFAIVAVAASSASAAVPNILPTGAAFNNTSGATEFGSGITAIKSAKDKGKGTITAEKEGTFENIFEGSKDQLGRTCTGLSDAIAGNVTVTGKLDVRWDTTLTKVLVLFLLDEVHLACGTTLIKVKGCVAGQYLSALNVPLKEGLVDLIVKEGDNVPITVENAADNGTEKCELKASLNEETAILSSESGTETLKEITKGLGAGKNELEVMTK
jgi:hypothetical protein